MMGRVCGLMGAEPLGETEFHIQTEGCCFNTKLVLTFI